MIAVAAGRVAFEVSLVAHAMVPVLAERDYIQDDAIDHRSLGRRVNGEVCAELSGAGALICWAIDTDQKLFID